MKRTMIPMSDYVAINNPQEASQILRHYRISPAKNVQDLMYKLRAAVSLHKDDAVIRLKQVHPDRWLFAIDDFNDSGIEQKPKLKEEKMSNACGACSGSSNCGGGECHCGGEEGKISSADGTVANTTPNIVPLKDNSSLIHLVAITAIFGISMAYLMHK